MTMVSMKLAKTKADKGSEAVPEGDAPAYPYGLCLSLDDGTMKKLGMGLPSVGTKFMVMAAAEVVRASASESQDGEKISAELQITDIQIAPEGRAFDPKGMYPKSKHE